MAAVAGGTAATPLEAGVGVAGGGRPVEDVEAAGTAAVAAAAGVGTTAATGTVAGAMLDECVAAPSPPCDVGVCVGWPLTPCVCGEERGDTDTAVTAWPHWRQNLA